ncbi:MAG: S41 family peptidase [Candidatus Wallbacteria bacterium]
MINKFTCGLSSNVLKKFKLAFFILFLTCFIIFNLSGVNAASTSNSTGIAYKDIPAISSYFLYTHVTQREMNETIYVRMVHNFIKMLDPTKLFFLADDVTNFENEAQKNSKALLEDFKNSDCSYFIKIHTLFKQRFEERYADINSILNDKFQPLPQKETENLDSPEAQFLKSTAEIELRLKKILSIQYEGLKAAKKPVDEIIKKLKKRYEEIHKHYSEFDSNKIADYVLKSFATGLDPHSLYFNPTELENFNISFKLSLEGIGATLKSDDGYTIIDSLVPGSPAKNSGKIIAGDKIIAVGQENGDMLDVIGMDLDKVVQKIRGPKGTKVRLSILRELKSQTSETFLVSLVRDKIKLVDQAVKKDVKVIDGKKYGVISVPSFYEDAEGLRKNKEEAASCSKDVRKALEYFKGTGEIEGVILDLRSNTGGSLMEAVRMAGLFIKRGVVVMVKDAYGRVQELPDEDADQLYKGNLVVLINKLSASASEIVAGALKDYGRAVVAGDTTTYGKGSVQTMLNLPNNLGAIKVTNAIFYTAGGASTQKKGVSSDIIIPSLTEEFKHGESTAEYALDWSIISSSIPKIAADEFISVRDESLSKIIPLLAGNSKKRIDENPKFKELTDKTKKKKIDEDGLVEGETNENEIKKKDDLVLDEAINILKDMKQAGTQAVK